jgi:hypothetical protein
MLLLLLPVVPHHGPRLLLLLQPGAYDHIMVSDLVRNTTKSCRARASLYGVPKKRAAAAPCQHS